MAPPTQSDLAIRALTASDVHTIRSLHVSLSVRFGPLLTTLCQSSTLPVHYPPAFFTQLLVLPSRACLIAVRRSKPNIPIAFISAALHKSSVPSLPVPKALDSPRPRIEILTLGVLPAYQHMGIARRLVAAVVEKLCGPLSAGIVAHANVSTVNSTAIKFYQSIGLCVSSDVIPNLYRTCSYGHRDAYLVAGRLDDL